LIAYDTNILIYALEGTSSWSKAAQSIVQRGEQEGAVLSVLAWQELLTGVVLHEGDSVELVATLRDLGATKFVPVNLGICERAVNLTKRYGRAVYGYDAIHIATAIENKAEVFITNDKMLTNLRLDEIAIQAL
jgi:predicted nucleic acid-binding protein